MYTVLLSAFNSSTCIYLKRARKYVPLVFCVQDHFIRLHTAGHSEMFDKRIKGIVCYFAVNFTSTKTFNSLFEGRRFSHNSLFFKQEFQLFDVMCVSEREREREKNGKRISRSNDNRIFSNGIMCFNDISTELLCGGSKTSSKTTKEQAVDMFLFIELSN